MATCSVMKEIQKIEKEIKACNERVGMLENNIKSGRLSEDKELAVRSELKEVAKLLKTYEKQLSTLHKTNRKSFMFAAGLCLAIFTLYMLYILISNPEYSS